MPLLPARVSASGTCVPTKRISPDVAPSGPLKMPLTTRPSTRLSERLAGGTPLANRSLNLVDGLVVSGILSGPLGATSGEIRFVGTQVPDADTRAGSNGIFSLSVSASDLYRPLLIPDSPTLAPLL